MRVTQRMLTDNAIRYMDENLQRLQAYQEQVSTGKAFQRPSDDPAAATMALTLRSNLETIESYLNTTKTTDDWMSATDKALQQAVEIGTRASNLALSGISDSQGAEERQALAAEMDILLKQAVDLGNTSHQDSYLFSGFKTKTAPFTLVENDSDPFFDAVGYNGDNGVIVRHLGPDQTIPQNIDGQQVFSPLFTAIIDARDALNANRTDLLQTALDDIQSAVQGISLASTTNGARQRQVRLTGERIEKTQVELKSLLSKKEDVNMAEAIANLRYQETVYQTVLEVSQRSISALSLFDMLS
jgi:flagellar hook-associated protein 3 FlgL